MKRIIAGLICLFLTVPCFAYNFDEMERSLNDMYATRAEYRLDRGMNIFGGVLKLGIAYWGFKQKSAYGNVTALGILLGSRLLSLIKVLIVSSHSALGSFFSTSNMYLTIGVTFSSCCT